MARYIDKDHWEEEILIPNTNTPILGGQPVWEGDRLVDGFANIPPAILADRTRHLKNKVESIEYAIGEDFQNVLKKEENLADLEDIQQAKYNLELNLVDNTRDSDKPVSGPQQAALDTKVDKIPGKGLSTEDYTTAEKNKLAGVQAGAQVNAVTSVAGRVGAVVLSKNDVGLNNVDNTSDLNKPISTATQTALNGKVDLTDSRLTNAREWTASTVSQAEAEGGVATTRRAWTAQRVRQAIAAFAAPLTRNVSTGAGLQGGGNLTQDREISVVFGNTSDTVTQGNDPRLSDPREWTASVVSQAEAEAGTSTTARKWTAQRVRQAISTFAAPLTRNINTGTGLTGGGNLTADRTISVVFGNEAGTVTEGNDSRLSDSREWVASTVSQAEAEAGTSTTMRKWSAQRVRQAILGWWNSTGLQSTIEGKANSSVTLTTGTGLIGGGDLTDDIALSVDFGNTAGTVTEGNDPRLSNSREWTASVVSQSEAEAGTATTARKWTAQRVRQAISAIAAPFSRKIDTGTGLQGGGDLSADRTLSVVFGNAAGTVTEGNDSRLSNSREWTASTVSQAEAEAGSATTRRAWTAQRVRQSILAWWGNTGLESVIAGKAESARTITAGNGLSGGGNLTANRTLTLGTPSTITGSTTNSVTSTSHTHAISLGISDVTGLSAAIDGKVDKVAGMGLSQESFTTAEKNKLALLEESHFKGLFPSLAALEAAVPNPKPGDYAQVAGTNPGDPSVTYVWDDPTEEWVEQVPEISAEQVKSLYESNPDTNAFTDGEKTKLAGIATGATKNQTDAYLLNRSNHTGSQAISTIINLQTTLNSKADTSSLGTAAFANLTSSATEAVTGKVMKVDDFGLGSYNASNYWTDLNEDSRGSGFYYITSSTSNSPITSGGGVLIHRQAGTAGAQILMHSYSNSMYFRTRSSNTWRGWDQVYHTGNLNLSDYLQKSNNLSDVANVSTARTNLGLGTAATSNVTTSVNDPTLGRVLKVGDFGLGATGSTPNTLLDNMDRTDRPIGFYSWRSAAVGEKPPVSDTNGTLIHTGYRINTSTETGTPFALQIAASNTDVGLYFRQLRGANGWDSWKEIYHSGNLDLSPYLKNSNNLSELTNVATARTNLGLGTSATVNLTTSTSSTSMGQVTKVGDYGFPYTLSVNPDTNLVSGVYHIGSSSQTIDGIFVPAFATYLNLMRNSSGHGEQLFMRDGRMLFRTNGTGTSFNYPLREVWHTGNFDPSSKLGTTENAASATQLATARTINGTPFDGTSNITTSSWGTARNIKIGSTSKSVNGSGNVSWSLDEIGSGIMDYSTNPIYYSGSAGFDLNDLPAGARCLISQSPSNSNVPLGDTFWYVECVNSYNGTTRIQRAYTYSVGTRPKFALRQFQNSNWTDWQVFDMGALDASNITTGTIPDARLPTTQSGKTFTSPIQVTGTFDINGSGPGQQQNGLYIADLGGTKGTTNNPTYTTALAWQTSSSRSNAISVDDQGRLWAFRSHSNAGTYTFQSRVEQADKLTSSRTINGTSFDGSANITTSNWGTARNITIGNSTKSVNGSGNVSWSVSEIGAVANGNEVTFGSTDTFRFLAGGSKNYIQSGNGSGANGWNNIVFSPYLSSAPAYLEITNSGIISPSLTTTASSGIRLKSSTANTGYGVIHHNDGNDYYILLTNNNDADGAFNSFRPFRINLSTGVASINGNAGTATSLETSRTINGTSFNGTSNITTANWGTARNITIGNTTKSVNGGSNVSWSLAEIGAGTSNLTIGTTAGTAKEGNWLPTSATKTNVLQGSSSSVFVTPSSYFSTISWAAGTHSSGTVTLNLDTSLNHNLTVSGNITMASPSNADAGKTGDIAIRMTANGTVSWNTNWKFLGSVPDIGTNGDVWVISYKVLNSSFIIAAANKVVS